MVYVVNVFPGGLVIEGAGTETFDPLGRLIVIVLVTVPLTFSSTTGPYGGGGLGTGLSPESSSASMISNVIIVIIA